MGLELLANPAVVSAIIGGGAGLQGVSAYESGKRQAAIAKYNAGVAKAKATATRTAGATEQHKKRREMRRTLSKNRVATAAAGVQMSGSPLDAQLMTIKDYAADISQIGVNYETRARAFDTEAVIAEQMGKSAEQAGKLGVASAVIGGASGLARFNLAQRLNT